MSALQELRAAGTLQNFGVSLPHCISFTAPLLRRPW